MILYNLKDKNESVSFKEAVIKGIGHDQGLFFVDKINKFSEEEIDALLDLDLVPRSQKILRHLIGDEIAGLDSIIESAFDFKAPLSKVEDNIYCLELFHGPTLAFKDFGARFMARVLSSIIDNKKLTILTATSGDTGAAVARAFYKQKGINVVILYPKGKISPLQEKLISTLGENIHAVEVNGDFDMCQDMVKKAFLDRDFVNTVGLNSANSINVSRLFAQICYYFEAVSQLPKEQRNKVVFSVPCGNFGNITAGLIAKSLGLKAKFIVSCNANDTVPRYLKDKVWDPHKTIATLSNAMDISRPNNWPRVEALYKINNWNLDELISDSISDAVTIETIQDLYKRTSYITEPHAAVAYKVLSSNLKDDEIGIFLGTAHVAKFKDSVEDALNISIDIPNAIKEVMDKDDIKVNLDASFDILKDYMLNTLKL